MTLFFCFTKAETVAQRGLSKFLGTMRTWNSSKVTREPWPLTWCIQEMLELSFFFLLSQFTATIATHRAFGVSTPALPQVVKLDPQDV